MQHDIREGESATVASAHSERAHRLTAYVSAKDVQRALGCSRAVAYRHLKRATGRSGRGLLRAPVEVWETYARRVFAPDVAAVGTVVECDVAQR